VPNVGILGVSGYSGQELQALLSRHGGVGVVALERESDAGGEVRRHGLALVFLATPHEVSLAAAPAALEAGAKVVDLSGAFRLKDPAVFARWYGMEHSAPALLAEAVYGLTELNAEAVRAARLVANPGCYPTSVICGLHPLLCAGAVDVSAGVICDSKSGVSGAGHKPAPSTHFVEVNENFKAYALLRHRHAPEMMQALGLSAAEFFFTAHLLPIARGILSTMYVKLRRAWSRDELLALYRQRYPQGGFIRVRQDGAPNLRDVARTNYCDIYLALDDTGTRAVVVSCIDNLVKGAAGQAIQNMNLMLGFEQGKGLM
jgi:N-acetyl-gamma-glutamyl-phosphate reductase